MSSHWDADSQPPELQQNQTMTKPFTLPCFPLTLLWIFTEIVAMFPQQFSLEQLYTINVKTWGPPCLFLFLQLRSVHSSPMSRFYREQSAFIKHQQWRLNKDESGRGQNNSERSWNPLAHRLSTVPNTVFFFLCFTSPIIHRGTCVHPHKCVLPIFPLLTSPDYYFFFFGVASMGK